MERQLFCSVIPHAIRRRGHTSIFVDEERDLTIEVFLELTDFTVTDGLSIQFPTEGTTESDRSRRTIERVVDDDVFDDRDTGLHKTLESLGEGEFVDKFHCDTFIDSKNYDGQSALQRHHAPPQRAGRSAESKHTMEVSPQRLVRAGDTGRQKRVLDVDDRVEVGRTIGRTTGAGSDVHRRHRPRVVGVIECNLDRREVATVAKLRDNFIQFCSVGLRKENHL